MAIRTTRYTADVTAQRIMNCTQTTSDDRRTCVISNPTGNAGTVYIGGVDVTAANGLAIGVGENFTLDGAGPSDDLYLTAASAVAGVQVLITRGPVSPNSPA